MKMERLDSWIGVDLDGTLAEYGSFDGTNIGKPIEDMQTRVVQWLRSGKKVKIFTARVAHDSDREQEKAVKAWCKKHLGEELEVTCKKDFAMIELWDDRAVTVEFNTGKVLTKQ